MNGSRWSLSVMVLMSFLLIGYAAQLSSMKQMPGLGALSGTVEAPKAAGTKIFCEIRRYLVRGALRPQGSSGRAVS